MFALLLYDISGEKNNKTLLLHVDDVVIVNMIANMSDDKLQHRLLTIRSEKGSGDIKNINHHSYGTLSSLEARQPGL